MGLLLLTLYKLIRWQLDVTWRSQFLECHTKSDVLGGLNFDENVPSGSNICWLGIHRIVPASCDYLKPTLSIDRYVDAPKAPSMKVFPSQGLLWHLVPHRATVGRDFYPDGPVTAPAERPASNSDLSVVNDNGFIDGRHDSAGDGHILDRETVGICRIVLSNLRAVIYVFFLLDGSAAGFRKRVDLVEPLATPSYSWVNATEDQNIRQRLT